jgi:hypothetical protein
MSDAGLGRETVAATDVHDLVLGAAGVRVAETVAATVPGAVPAAVPAT